MSTACNRRRSNRRQFKHRRCRQGRCLPATACGHSSRRWSPSSSGRTARRRWSSRRRPASRSPQRTAPDGKAAFAGEAPTRRISGRVRGASGAADGHTAQRDDQIRPAAGDMLRRVRGVARAAHGHASDGEGVAARELPGCIGGISGAAYGDAPDACLGVAARGATCVVPSIAAAADCETSDPGDESTEPGAAVVDAPRCVRGVSRSTRRHAADAAALGADAAGVASGGVRGISRAAQGEAAGADPEERLAVAVAQPPTNPITRQIASTTTPGRSTAELVLMVRLPIVHLRPEDAHDAPEASPGSPQR